MTKIFFSTGSVSWVTGTIRLDPDTNNSTSWISSAFNSSSATQSVYANGISAVICNNGLILANTAKEDDFVFSTLYKKLASNWTTVNSNFDIDSIYSISYGNGLWAAAGGAAKIRISTNGVIWTTVNSNFGGTTINSIAYGNGLWIAVGQTGQMRTSTNGSTWTTVTSNFGATVIHSIAYGNGLWIAGGASGTLRSSTDGVSWTAQNSNFGNTSIFSIAYGNGLWIAGGYTGTIRTSTNGSTWTTQTSNFSTANIFSVAYGNGLWVAGGMYGRARSSTNGSTWTTVTSNFGSTWIFSIFYENNLWLAGGDDGQIRISTNSVVWTTVTSNFGTSTIRGISYGNGIWVIAGHGAKIRISQNETNVPPNTKIFPNNNSFLAIYQNDQQNIYSSNNLENYSSIALLWTTTTSQLNSIINKNNISDLILANSGMIYKYNSSTTNWNQINTGISDNFITGAVSTDGIYNIVGENAIYNSTDLISWTSMSFVSASAVNDIISK